MKKIKIITFHSAENAGASLQCYALQESLKKMGCNVQIIDYQPPYLKEQYKVFVNPFKYVKKDNFIKSFLAFSFQNVFFFRRIKRKVNYKKFRKHFLSLTREYASYEELRKNPPEGDAYICGSDQIWNPSLTGDAFDPAYFLDFGSTETKRYSYAVSIGKSLLPDEIDSIVEFTKKFVRISFRENSVKDIFLNYMISERVCSSIDPTLLIDAKDWEDRMVSSKDYNSKYILVYGLEPNKNFQKLLDSAKERFPDTSVMDLSQCNLRLKGRIQRKFAFSPNEFLSLIHEAEFIITNSFHCTVFSVIFQKNFYTLPHSRSSSRMEDFLDNFKLSDRLYKAKGMQWVVEYDGFDKLVASYREESLKYLKFIINDNEYLA